MTEKGLNKANAEVLKADILEKWNPERFGLVRFPHVVGKLDNVLDFEKPFRNVLDMPIKLPHSDIRIPDDLQRESLLNLIEQAVEFEKSINPNFDDYYMYLTVHHSTVRKGVTQRRAGAHIDGMQGERYSEKLPVCHSYLVSNNTPTRFFNHSFQTDLCEKTQNWFYEMDKVKDYEKSSLSVPFEINFMTAYSVHESTPTPEDTTRTFMRLEFSLKKFDRTGNTVNNKFSIEWEYQDRSIPSHLKTELFN